MFAFCPSQTLKSDETERRNLLLIRNLSDDILNHIQQRFVQQTALNLLIKQREGQETNTVLIGLRMKLNPRWFDLLTCSRDRYVFLLMEPKSLSLFA